MPELASINGTILPPDAARVSAFDRGFLLGDRVSDALRTYGGRPFALEEHLGRLQRSARLAAMSLPVSIGQFASEISELLRAGGNAESYVRIVVTRGTGGLELDPEHARDPTRVLIASPLIPLPAALYRDGAAAITVPLVGGPGAAAIPVVSHDIARVLAARDARIRGAHEAFVFTPTGEISTAASASLFVVLAGVLATPAASAAGLRGVTAERVIDAAREGGIKVIERAISLSDLWTADEVFVTSTLRELLPVVRVDEHEVADGRPGAVTRRLHRAFRQRTAIAALPMPWD